MSKIISVLKRWYDDALVILFTAAGVFINGILPDLLAVQRGQAQTFIVSPMRIITACILSGVLILLEIARGGSSEEAKVGKQKNVGFRVALGFFAGYTLTGLTA